MSMIPSGEAFRIGSVDQYWKLAAAKNDDGKISEDESGEAVAAYDVDGDKSVAMWEYMQKTNEVSKQLIFASSEIEAWKGAYRSVDSLSQYLKEKHNMPLEIPFLLRLLKAVAKEELKLTPFNGEVPLSYLSQQTEAFLITIRDHTFLNFRAACSVLKNLAEKDLLERITLLNIIKISEKARQYTMHALSALEYMAEQGLLEQNGLQRAVDFLVDIPKYAKREGVASAYSNLAALGRKGLMKTIGLDTLIEINKTEGPNP